MIVNRNLLYILLLKLFGTFFAFFIYSKFTTLGDAKGYAENVVPFSISSLVDRTEFVEILYSTIQIITNSTLVTYSITSLLVGYVIFHVFKETKAFKSIVFWVAISLPHFLIWTGVSTKEAISVPLFLLFVKYVYMYIRNENINKISFITIVLISVFIRPHYGIAYIYLLLASFIIKKTICENRLRFFSIGSNIFLLFLLFLLFLFALFLSVDLWSYYFYELMDVSRNFFIGFDDAKSTRYYLMENWKDMGDFLDLFVSGVFMSQIGPTLLESINKPIFFLVFLEGVVYIYIFVYIVIRFYKLSKIDKTNKLVFVYAFLPAVLGIILIHYPFGIFNPGTAIRYKQSLVPLLIFFPMLMVYGRKITNEKY